VSGIYDPTAIKAILAKGGHLVLCGQNKRPMQRAWNQFPATPNAIRRHRGLLGLVPASVGTSALDVDEGLATQLMAKYPPFVSLRTRRKQGLHLYYGDRRSRPNGKFEAFGCRGDVRSGSGYLIIWPGGERRLASALQTSAVEDFPFPMELTAHRPNRRAPVVASGPCGSLSHVVPGERNNALFDAVRLWSYRQPKGPDHSIWIGRVVGLALQLNGTMPIPLPAAEARSVGSSVARWTWQRFGSGFQAQGYQ